MKLDVRRTFLVGLAFLSISAFWQVYDNIVPLMLEHSFQLNAKIVGMIMGIDNILALFMLPLFGALSDRTVTKIGRRMPFIIAGTAIASISVVLLPLVERKGSLPLFIAVLGIVLFTMSCYRSPAVALMPDVTIKPLRSKANAVINLMGAIGGALMLVSTVLFVPDGSRDYLMLFITLAVLMVLSVGTLFATVHEPTAVQKMREDSAYFGIDEGGEEDHGTGKMEKAVFRSFVLILISIFLWFMGNNAVTSGISRYAANVWSHGVGKAATILLVAQAAAIVAFIPVGMIATKIGRKRTIQIGILFLIFAYGASVFFTDFNSLVLVFFALAGIGLALINVNSYPMVVDMSKGANIGRYTGFYYFASMAAQSVTPFFSGVFIDQFGYRVLFPYACVFLALSFLTMLFVRHGDSRPTPRKDKLEAFDIED